MLGLSGCQVFVPEYFFYYECIGNFYAFAKVSANFDMTLIMFDYPNR